MPRSGRPPIGPRPMTSTERARACRARKRARRLAERPELAEAKALTLLTSGVLTAPAAEQPSPAAPAGSSRLKPYNSASCPTCRSPILAVPSATWRTESAPRRAPPPTAMCALGITTAAAFAGGGLAMIGVP